MYEPLQVSKCKECGKVIAELKELVRFRKRAREMSSPEADKSYLVAYVRLDFSLQMREELKRELPFMLEQYLRKKGKDSHKIWSKLDKETKTEKVN